MISVVMATLNSERDLIEALSPLVPGSIEGLVTELVVADGGSTDQTLAILDEAGAVMVQGGVAAAAKAAKGPWLLIMTPSARLTYDWIGPARRHLEVGGPKPARLVRPGLLARTEALLIPKAAYAPGKTGGRKLRI